MKTRIITALILTALFLPVLIFSDTPVFPLAMSFVGVVSVYEMGKCVKVGKPYILLPSYIAATVMPFAVRYLPHNVFIVAAFIFAVAYTMYLFGVTTFSHGKIALTDLSVLFMTSVYIIASCTAIVYVRDFEDVGKYIYMLIFFGAWFTDIFAYFCGMLLGKHKLIPDVSPKKTVEGSIGGIFFATLSFLIYGIITNTYFGTHSNLYFLCIAGVVVSVLSQIGDLLMSHIKRHYGIKDYGSIFPGHGGMLDRFDSILAVAIGLAAICMLSSLTGIRLF